MYTIDDVKRQMFLMDVKVTELAKYYTKEDGTKGVGHSHISQLLNGNIGASDDTRWRLMQAVSDCANAKNNKAETDKE